MIRLEGNIMINRSLREGGKQSASNWPIALQRARRCISPNTELMFDPRTLYLEAINSRVNDGMNHRFTGCFQVDQRCKLYIYIHLHEFQYVYNIVSYVNVSTHNGTNVLPYITYTTCIGIPPHIRMLPASAFHPPLLFGIYRPFANVVELVHRRDNSSKLSR